MAMRGDWRLNGKHFRETQSSGASRYTHRYFIDGALVTEREFFLAYKEAKKAEEKKKQVEA